MEQLKINDKFLFTAPELALQHFNFVHLQQGHYHCLFQNKSYNLELIDHDQQAKTLLIKVNGHLFTASGKDRYDILLEKMGINSSSQQKHFESTNARVSFRCQGRSRTRSKERRYLIGSGSHENGKQFEIPTRRSNPIRWSSKRKSSRKRSTIIAFQINPK